MYVWLYPRTFHPYRFIRDIMVRPYRIPPALLYLLCRVIAVPLFALYGLMARRGRTRRHSYGEVVLGLFDNLSPEHQSRHTPEEVAGWYARAGFEDVTRWDPPVGVSGRRRAGAVAATGAGVATAE